MKRPRSDRLCEEGVQARLYDRAMPSRDGRDLRLIRVDSPDIVAIGGQTGRGDGADIAEPEDCDLHFVPGRRRGGQSLRNVAILTTEPRKAW